MKFMLLLTLILMASFSEASVTKSARNPHEYQILSHEDLGSEVKQTDFYFIVGAVHALYAPEAKKQNREMVVATLDWENPYFSAWAKYDEQSNTYQTNFWGGFARLPDMTKRAFVFTACHEVGHLLGETPRISIEGMTKMSAEGQADFFAANSCFKKFITKHPSYFSKEIELDPYAASLCQDKFQDDSKNHKLCLETMQVARDFTIAINHLNLDMTPDFHTPDNLVVTETKESYPSLQCRMDIIVNSAQMPYVDGAITAKSLENRLSCWHAK